MAMQPERTIPYKTWVKASIVEALRQVFANHPDPKLRHTKVSVDYPTSELHYPSIVVRFFERTIRNAGVGHVEYLYNRSGSYTLVVKNAEDLVVDVVSADDNTVTTQTADLRAQGFSVKIFDQYTSVNKFRHFLYDGDIEFAVFALSSLDRDLISDTLVQALAMPDMAAYTKNFFTRIYNPAKISPADSSDYEPSEWNYVNLNTDRISGFGETQTPQPWLSEDQLVYQTSYRVSIYGEFYSLPPLSDQPAYGLISDVKIYPYDKFTGEGTPVSVDGADTEIDPQWDDPYPNDNENLAFDPTQWH